LTSDTNRDLRDYLFRALTFEAEAGVFRAAGIRVGADVSEAEAALLDERLEPFGIQRRNDAIEMARLYATLFCFENEVRDLIRERLSEKIGAGWWDALSASTRKLAQRRQKAARKDPWSDGDEHAMLCFCDFGSLYDIISDQWEHFEDVIPSRQWLKQRMDRLEKARKFIAHNRRLMPGESDRLYLYVSDWNRVVGL
jgi:hypothetical protein